MSGTGVEPGETLKGVPTLKHTPPLEAQARPQRAPSGKAAPYELRLPHLSSRGGWRECPGKTGEAS